MNLSFAVPTPLDHFAMLVDSDADFALFEAAISLAQDDYPEIDVQTILSEVDQLLARIRRRIPVDAGALQKLQILNQFFFLDLKFGGNVNNYYDPDNSFVNVLLRTRRGIPISLGILWMELAQGLGLTVWGVGFPGHFMVKANLPMGQAVMDPVSGKSLSREALLELLEPYHRPAAQGEGFEDPLELYLRALKPRDIIARMLHNLKEIHQSQDDFPRLLAVQERLIVLLPESWPEYRDRGLTHAALGHTAQAVADLECYLVHADDVVDSDAIAERVDALRGQHG